MLQHKSRFKNYLINPDSLWQESQQMAVVFAELKNRIQTEILKPAEQVLLFVLMYLQQRKGQQWMMPSGKKVPLQESQGPLLDMAVEYRIRRLPQAIFDVLWGWGLGKYDLLLWNQIPSPFEMLDYQSQGKRIVTMDLEKAVHGQLVDGHRDAFEFLLHDLLHADLFFKDAESHHQQKSFFVQLKDIVLREKLLETADDLFLKDLSYLMSDMNSHRAHLAAHFQAILISWKLRQEQRPPQALLSAQGLDWVQRVTI